MLPGRHIDSIWSNSYVVQGRCQIIDREWVWGEALPMNVVVIRSIYNLLTKIDENLPLAKALQARGGRSLIRAIGACIDVDLIDADFVRFVDVETELQWQTFGVSKSRHKTYLRWYLVDRKSLQSFVELKRKTSHAGSRVAARLGLSH